MNFTKIAFCFTAGCLGGIATNVLTILFGTLNIPDVIGVDMSPSFDLPALYSDLFWGGIYGLLFLIPFLNSFLFLKGIILSLVPTLVQVLVIFPFYEGAGFLGQELGTWAPVLVFIYQIAWGLVAAAFLTLTQD
ncbi:MAG: hypothetical protein KDK72_05865 [Chlamydiia bacterium]|nr:hypothetical protein [Chlamydiia bacterium]